MSSMYQVGLGLRSLAIKSAVFVLLAGIFAWVIGGSIFPGSQVVNLLSFPWQGETWHAQITGNGRSPAPVEWRLVRVRADESESIETFGLTGVWRAIYGPRFLTTGIVLGVEVQRDELATWWMITIDADGTAVTRQVGTVGELFAALALPVS
ncbi:MAG: hypothetical protein EXS17_00645 [Phycisphaerales bacterium]|nr:hypothetical protein [Phycisphaerales bacterium]